MWLLVLQMLSPLIKFGIELFVKARLLKEENAKVMLESLKQYEKSGTPAESQNAYKKILKQIEDEKKQP